MLAAQIDIDKYNVTIYEKKKTVGRKFLVAGEGGLNLTYNSPIDDFINQYSPSDFMNPIIRDFTNNDFRNWLDKIGIQTFAGSSNRVFPKLDIKPAEVLNKITEFISSKNITFQFNKKWIGWKDDGQLVFEGEEIVNSDITVFALGGSSWKVTGSDGIWANTFKNKGILVKDFYAANCAFEVNWNTNFLATHQGKPLKNITLTYKEQIYTGELVISSFGLEGNAIYPLSEKIQESLLKGESVIINLDLKPSLSVDQIKSKFNISKQSKITDILLKDLNLDRTAIALLKQFSDKETFLDFDLLAETIKSVPIKIESADEIDKAISTLGGIALDEIDRNFELKKIQNTYAIGEMLDWYAPTGGYLLQGCFSMGFSLAKHLNEFEFNKIDNHRVTKTTKS